MDSAANAETFSELHDEDDGGGGGGDDDDNRSCGVDTDTRTYMHVYIHARIHICRHNHILRGMQWLAKLQESGLAQGLQPVVQKDCKARSRTGIVYM